MHLKVFAPMDFGVLRAAAKNMFAVMLSLMRLARLELSARMAAV